ncbi:MAG: 2-dehydropantoate 2-reductase [Nitrospirae bacterium]|nr:2-dehydropantoate 2-reductase [Nitrospirota bacterium]
MRQVMMVGAGAVGGYFGAHLAKGNPNVSFLLRPRTLQAVRDHGLTIRSADGSLTVHPPAASDPHDLPKPDLIILSVKAYDLTAVMNQIESVVDSRTVFLTLQNGVEAEDRLLERFTRDCVVGGVAFIYSKNVSPGVIEHYKRGALAVGELMGHESPRVRLIADLFKQAGLSCQIVGDIRRDKWEKMCWNCAFNPLTVIINDRVSKALDHPEMLNVIHDIVGEVAAVAAGLKVPLTEDIADKVVQWSQEIRDIHTSMYDDWKAGRPTEIDFMNGYIVRKGRDLGIPTPVNEALTAMIKVITEREKSGSGVLRIEGAVVQPITLDGAALARLPMEFQVPDVSVLMSGMRGRGIRVRGLLEVPALAIGADHATFHSHDGQFAASLTLKQAQEHGILIYQLDEGPLPEQEGGPFRLVTPGLGDLCANVKGLARIELTTGPGKDTRPSMKGSKGVEGKRSKVKGKK